MNNKPTSTLEKLAIRMTEWIGSVQSLIVHTIAFVVIFGLMFFGIGLDAVLLILTTAVSLEAIYMAIFIQMTVNRNTQSLEEVEKDIDEIQVDVGEMHEEVESLEKDVDEIQKDVDEISDEISDDEADDTRTRVALEKIEAGLAVIRKDMEDLKKGK